MGRGLGVRPWRCLAGGLALLISLGLAGPGAANDSTAELQTGGLRFVQNDDVAMTAEKLFISLQRIEVDYVFHNRSNSAVETLVAFPMPDIEGAEGDDALTVDPDAGDNFLGFSVEQDGRPITPNLQQQAFVQGVDLTAELKALDIPLLPNATATRQALARLSPETFARLATLGLVRSIDEDGDATTPDAVYGLWTLKSVYWWKTVYPPGRDITVRHRYRTSVGGTVQITYLDENGQPRGPQWDTYLARYCLDEGMVKVAQKDWKAIRDGKPPAYYENWISYILMTGNNWAGPIGTFTLIVDKGDPRAVVSFCGQNVRKTGPTTFEMTARDFSPERDLQILLLRPVDSSQP